ncbi:MAG: MG2 domain-containing protein, partial [Flavisolibacter sp.]
MNCFRLLLLFAGIFLCTSMHGQVRNYESQWKNVDQLATEKNLPASALAEVKKIYAQAKKEKQEAQVIKALVYMVNLQSQNTEDNQVKAIAEMENELRSVTEPSLSILKNYLATLYLNYYQQVQWQLYNRTATENFVKTDIATWSADDFHKTISRLYLESIQNDKILKHTRLEPWDAIIMKGTQRKLRPTLYDLLSHAALDYFKNDERDIRKPSYAFEIIQPEAFAPAEEFIKVKFSTKDSSSLQQKALLVYQDLIRFHMNDQNTDALIDVDIDRIQFVYEKSVAEQKDSLYVKALEHILNRYPNTSTIQQARYLLALYYYNLVQNNIETPDSSYKSALLKAKELFEKIVADSIPKTQTWADSHELLSEIKQKSFSFQLEKVNLPGQAFRCLVNYQNIGQLYFRVVSATESLKKAFRDNDYTDNSWEQLAKAIPVKTWTQPLTAETDYINHSIEIKIDPLPVGEYYLFASYDQQFTIKGNRLSAQLFYVSNISFINREREYFVLHRETGLPLRGAKVQMWKKRYDRKSSAYIKEKSDVYQTDDHGYFQITDKKTNEYFQYQLEFTYNNDRLFIDDELNGYYSGVYKNPADTISAKQFEVETAYTYLFTDRSIYRPGQTVYFKGIIISNTREGHKKLMTGFKSTIYLQNANYKVVDSLEILSNDYGSFSGKFSLPSNTLNGNFSMEMKKNRGTIGFNVEEYKRPKFFVEFEKIHDAYKVNDSITLSGNAKAYAGNQVDGAKVVYRVVRQPRMLYDWLSWKIWPPRGPAMEVTHGETVTDVNGKF